MGMVRWWLAEVAALLALAIDVLEMWLEDE